MNGLSPWRVEVLRIVRTRRLLVLGVLYLFFGASGPLVARYTQQIFSHVGGGSTVSITFATPQPADGMLGFQKSAMQLGLIACVVIAALALCVDDRPALSVYYRTRTRSRVSLLFAPRLAVTVLATAGAYTLGFLFAWYETYALLGAPSVAATVQTWALGLSYTVFAVALTFLASGFFRSTLGTVGCTITVIVLLPVLGEVRTLTDYLPSRLTTLPADVYHGVAHRSPLAALLVTAAVALLGGELAVRLVSRRRPAR